MRIVRTSSIDWSKAIDSLTSEAYFMLSILAYKNLQASDKSIMPYTRLGLSTYRKYKKELTEKGYLTIEQVAKAQYLYTIGDING